MELEKLKKIIIRKILGTADEEEVRLLDQWLAKSAANRELLQELTSGAFLKKAVCDGNRELRYLEWEKLERLTVRKQIRLVRSRWLKIAAAVLLPFLGGLSFWLLQTHGNDGVTTEIAEGIRPGSFKAIIEFVDGKQNFLSDDILSDFEYKGVRVINRKDTLYLVNSHVAAASADSCYVIRIPRGGEYIACLEDGTVVHLNSDTEMKIPVNFGIGERRIWLNGEAFFDVAYDKDRVFTVHTDKADISVLGTEFDIRAYGNERDVVTTLVEGSVRVNSGNASDRLEPGYQACVPEQGKILSQKVNVYPYIAWTKGRMEFENERLEQIMADLQRWYDFEVFYTDSKIKDLRFTIDILKYDDIIKVLNLMEKMNKVAFTRKDRTVIMSNR